MSLNIEQVHKMERNASGRDVLVKASPYARFVQSPNGAIAVQGGRFYSDGGGQPVIPYSDVPDWAWKAVKAMTPDGRIKVGLPANFEELKEPVLADEVSKPAPKLGKESETVPVVVAKTIVDFVYELDHSIDAHWTKSGMPDLNALKELAGYYTSRDEVEAACPDYRRKES